MMKRTLGAPSFARSGSGHAGDETSNVRPITPGNAVPGLYSTNAIRVLLSRLPMGAARKRAQRVQSWGNYPAIVSHGCNAAQPTAPFHPSEIGAEVAADAHQLERLDPVH